MSVGIYEKVREHLVGYSTLSCAIRSKGCVYILFENDRDPDDESSDPTLRIVDYYAFTKKKWGLCEFLNMYKVHACVLPSPDKSFVAVDSDGSVVTQRGVTESEDYELEDPIPVLPQVTVNKVREIGGMAFAVGTLRTVFRRRSGGGWDQLFGNDLAVRDIEDSENRYLGFNDITGFSINELYACGGDGDLWGFDGERWRDLDCPTNLDLSAICTTPDGRVFVGGRNGLLMVGRNNHWEVVGRDEAGRRRFWIKDLVWYIDRLYLASDAGLYEYFDGKISPTRGLSGLVSVDEDGEVEEGIINDRLAEQLKEVGASEEQIQLASLPTRTNGGILAPASLHTVCTDGELLLLGGVDKVAVFDGDVWNVLYAPPGLDMGGKI